MEWERNVRANLLMLLCLCYQRVAVRHLIFLRGRGLVWSNTITPGSRMSNRRA